MTTPQKFLKLGNAIKRYRGRLDEKSGKWIAAPDRGARGAVLRWLEALDLHASELATIDGFVTFAQYRKWMEEKQAARAVMNEERRYR